MKVSKKIIMIMIFLSMISLGVSIYLEFTVNDIEIARKMHFDYFKNLFIGVFASGLLVFITTIVQYNIEKNNYYISMHRYLDTLLYSALNILSKMRSNDIFVYAPELSDFNIVYNKTVYLYSTFVCVFNLSKKDMLVESVINEVSKFKMMQEKLLEQYNKFKRNECSESDYKKVIETYEEKFKMEYKDKFFSYRKQIESNMKSLLDNRKLKTYIDM